MTPEETLLSIRAPRKLSNIDDVISVFDDRQALTLCEADFYTKLSGIVEQLLITGVPGDFFEAGVWRGGVALYLKSLLDHHGGRDRNLWLADTFAWFPPTIDERHVKDCKAYEVVSKFSHMAVSAHQVLSYFKEFGLYDERVVLLQGDLLKTLPELSARPRIALLHIDVDFYAPTYACLEHLYDGLAVGGYVLIDDYGASVYNCKEAVDDFRRRRSITEPIDMLTRYVACWRKSDGI